MEGGFWTESCFDGSRALGGCIWLLSACPTSAPGLVGHAHVCDDSSSSGYLVAATTTCQEYVVVVGDTISAGFGRTSLDPPVSCSGHGEQRRSSFGQGFRLRRGRAVMVPGRPCTCSSSWAEQAPGWPAWSYSFSDQACTPRRGGGIKACSLSELRLPVRQDEPPVGTTKWLVTSAESRAMPVTELTKVLEAPEWWRSWTAAPTVLLRRAVGFGLGSLLFWNLWLSESTAAAHTCASTMPLGRC